MNHQNEQFTNYLQNNNFLKYIKFWSTIKFTYKDHI
jgi:hypothetical protein